VSRAILRVVLALVLLAAPLAVEAQQTAKVPRIGFLLLSGPESPHFAAIRQRLEALG
jgi:hypothetical protein